MDTIQYKLIRKLTKLKITSQQPREVKAKNDYCQAQKIATPTKKSIGQENWEVCALISLIPVKHQCDLSTFNLLHFSQVQKPTSFTQQNEIPDLKSLRSLQEVKQNKLLIQNQIFMKSLFHQKSFPILNSSVPLLSTLGQCSKPKSTFYK